MFKRAVVAAVLVLVVGRVFLLIGLLIGGHNAGQEHSEGTPTSSMCQRWRAVDASHLEPTAAQESMMSLRLRPSRPPARPEPDRPP